MSTHRIDGDSEDDATPAAVRTVRAGWWGWAVILVAIFALALCASCSTPSGRGLVPDCPIVNVSYAELPDGGRVYLLDEENMRALLERGLEIQAGRCRMPVKASPTPPEPAAGEMPT